MDFYRLGEREAGWFIVIALMVLVMAAALGSLAGVYIRDAYWRKAAIDHGYAQHDPTTGEWMWREPKAEAPQR
jgi:hypothetical protein